MEITAISGIHHVLTINPPTVLDSNVIENSSLDQISPATICHKILSEGDNVGNRNAAPTPENTQSGSFQLTPLQNAPPPVLSKDSCIFKPIRLKTSDKLTKVIEKCKKLQKLSDQLALKKSQEVTEIVNVIPEVSECFAPENGNIVNTEASASVPEVSESIVRETSDEVSLLSDNLENESSSSFSSNSISISQSTNSSSRTSASNSDLVIKQFLFLFRPSDHEVLVRNKGINMYRCNVCGGMYRQKFSLKRHFLRTHINFHYISKSDISNCKIAVPNDYVPQDSNPESGKHRKKFKSSNAIFLENNKSGVMPGLYTCHICIGLKFDNEIDLREHYNKHSESERKKFQCDKCSASFFKKQVLSRHLANHGEKVIQKECKRCGAEFTSKVEYQKHLISHSSGRVCKYCSKILSTSANRKRHEALHLGLKPYRCTHCGICFAQSKDLDRHLKKQHGELCFFCDTCNKLFPSQVSLDLHLHEKHSNVTPKKAEIASPASPVVDKQNIINPVPEPVVPPIKLKICIVCKRSFPTFYAMMKHRTQAHPYHTKRKRHRKTIQQKLAAQAAANDLNQGIKVRKPYRKVAKHDTGLATSPARRGRPPLNRSVKFGSPNYRVGTRYVTKRERELAKKEEMEFYFNLSERIAENLLHYMDGKTSQLSLKEYYFYDQQYPSCNYEERGRFPWSNYNFPNGYDVEQALNTRGKEVTNDVPENLSNRDKCLYATGLNRVQKSSEESKTPENEQIESCSSNLENLIENFSIIDTKKMSLEERKELIGRKVSTICLCFVCKEKLESKEAFKEHCVNNHPNVDCSCIEIEGEKELPPAIPTDMCKQNISPDGIFFSWNVPPPLSETTLLKCTKCRLDFKTSYDLHSHIIKCGNLRSSPIHVWRINNRKRIKRTMKRRMSPAQQKAAVEAYRRHFKTPDKVTFNKNGTVSKSTEKVNKSVEKSQFYKSGRLQTTTTSFTVDMNYFKTKPVKQSNVTNTQSKRGRKSYATLSYRYRNASLPTAVIECSHCKQAFSSQSALNLHIQSHLMHSDNRRKEKKYNMTRTTSDMTTASLHSTSSVLVGGEANSIANAATLNPIDKHENNLVKLSHLTASSSLHSPKLPDNFTKIIDKGNFNNSEKTTVIDLSRANLHSKPIDLTASPPEKFRNINLTTSRKTALEIAMDAIREFYQTSEQNEHISNLQKTVEKLSPSTRVSPLSLEKSSSGKKVGRPKKVKRPGPYKKNLSFDFVNSYEATKAVSKLDETVNRLTKSKADSDTLPNEQIKSPIKTPVPIKSTDVVKNVPCLSKLTQSPTTVLSTFVDQRPSPSPSAFKTATAITLKTTNSFVPIFIYKNQGKTINALQLTTNSSKLNLLPVLSNASQKSTSSSLLESTQSSNSTPEKTITETCAIKILSNTQSSPDKKSEESCRSSGSQGRISPSLESIVNSIKQKLHSQEQETSSHDVPISWLEDEKFEISANSKVVSTDANSSSVPEPLPNTTALNEPCHQDKLKSPAISSQILTSNTQESDLTSVINITKENNTDASISLVLQPSNSDINSSLNTESSTMSNEKSANSLETSIVQSSEKDDPQNASPTDASDANGSSSFKNKQQDVPNLKVKKRKKKQRLFTRIKHRNQRMNLLKSESQNQDSVRKKPGRRRKVQLGANATVSNELSTIDDSKLDPPMKIIKSELPTQNAVLPDPVVDEAETATVQIERNMHVEAENDIPVTSTDKDLCSKSEVALDTEKVTFGILENDESQRPSLSSTPDSINAQHEDNLPNYKTSTLRAFRAKPQQVQPISSDTNSTVEPTTEFGRNLASRMKERMRLSLENASLESLIRSEEGNNSDAVPESSFSDINSQISDDDSDYLKAIKKEIESLEPNKKHSCPFCRLEFAYLTNFRRHLRVCRSRLLQIKEVEPVPSTSASASSPVLQYLPKKDEVEHSMLNLLRHQSRQTQMLKEAESNTGSKVENKFRTYSCNVCHRIYLSLFKLLQHQVTHKLVPQDSLEQITDLDNKDLNEIERYSINELEGRTLDNAVDVKNFEQSDINIINKQCNESELKVDQNTELNMEKDLASSSNVLEVHHTDLCNDESKKESIFVSEPSAAESHIKSNNECIQVEKSDSTSTNEIAKVGDQPVKRKRGRPVGWRKNANLNQEQILRKPTRKFKTSNKPKASLFAVKNKTTILPPSTIKLSKKILVLPNVNAKSRKAVYPKIALTTSENNPFEFTEDDLPPASLTLSNVVKTEDGSIKSQKKIVKKKFKTKQISLKKISDSVFNVISVSDDIKSELPTVPSENSPNFPSKTSANAASSDALKNNLNKITKLQRSILPKTEPLVQKANIPPKRRPGRPPRNFIAIPSTSRSKGFSQPSTSTRNFRKMMSRSVTVYSSDSEYEGSEEQEPAPKKRVAHLKVCPICKDKFSATLQLYRHIQLVHSRRSKTSGVKTESLNSPKTGGKNISKSPTSMTPTYKGKTLKKSIPKEVSKISDAFRPHKKDITSIATKSTSVVDDIKSFEKVNVKQSSVDECNDNNALKRNGKQNYSSNSNDSVQILENITPEIIEDPSVFVTKISKRSAAKSTTSNSFYLGNLKTMHEVDNASVTRVYKNTIAEPILHETFDTSIKTFKKENMEVNEVVTAEFVVDDNSDADSVKSNRFYALPQSNISEKLKKQAAKFITDDVSNADSSKIGIRSINNPKLGKKVVSKPSKNNSTKVMKAVLPHSVIQHFSDFSSDSDSSRSFRKSASTSKIATVYSSDTENIKKSRKLNKRISSIDTSDADSDFSSKTDVAPMKLNKVCPICKEKFTASLILHRHIQLMHSRKPNPAVGSNVSLEFLKSPKNRSSSLNAPKILPPMTPPKFHSSSVTSKIRSTSKTSMTALPLASPKIGSPTMSSPKISSVAMTSPKSSSVPMPSPKISSPTMTSPKKCTPPMTSPKISCPAMTSPKISSLPMTSPKTRSPATSPKIRSLTATKSPKMSPASSRVSPKRPSALTKSPINISRTLKKKSSKAQSSLMKIENVISDVILSASPRQPRQCRKPLPSFKRKWNKKDQPSLDQNKKS